MASLILLQLLYRQMEGQLLYFEAATWPSRNVITDKRCTQKFNNFSGAQHSNTPGGIKVIACLVHVVSLKRTPERHVFKREWTRHSKFCYPFQVMLSAQNGHRKDMCSKESGLHTQNFVTHSRSCCQPKTDTEKTCVQKRVDYTFKILLPILGSIVNINISKAQLQKEQLHLWRTN